MLLLQKYLCDGGTPESLQASLGIAHKRHGQHNNLVLFKYSMIDSPMDHPLVQECRGIILDQDDDWNIVAFPFVKFFNFGEPNAEKILWDSNCRVQEKVDGSIILLYYYAGVWNVATSGTPDAQTEVNGSGINFSTLFWNTLGGVDRALVEGEHDYCFMFELTSAYNRVVVDHKVSGLTLLGARRVDTWEEVHPSAVSHLFPTVPVVKEYPLCTIEDVYSALDKMNPLEQEGFVIVWDKPNGSKGRVKCKNGDYVLLHHAKDSASASLKNLVDIVRNGEVPEWIAAFPELDARMREIQMKYLELVCSLQEDYIRHAGIPIQRDFAMAIVGKSKCSSALFALRAGKVKSIKEYLASCQIDSVMHLLGYK